jgi:hypothetical protein
MEDQIDVAIRLPSTFTRHYRQVITRYLAKGWWQLSPSERRAGFEAFNILHAARVQRDDESLTFRQVYDVYVERTWSDRYIDELLALSNPVEEHSSLRRRFATLIVTSLRKVGLVQQSVPDSQVLLAYILHWWESFSAGYAFEVEIFHNLQESGIKFEAHDLRDRAARRSPYDLKVLGQPGDVKTSLYFLQRPQRLLFSQFYITRLDTGHGSRALVVFLKPEAWALIDGETLFIHLAELAEVWPQSAEIQVGPVRLVVADYQVWKDKVRRKQMQGGSE